jgi:hypothetical protein
VADAAGVSLSYLSRLRDGAKLNPSRDIVIRIGLAVAIVALRYTNLPAILSVMNEFLDAADYALITR